MSYLYTIVTFLLFLILGFILYFVQSFFQVKKNKKTENSDLNQKGQGIQIGRFFKGYLIVSLIFVSFTAISDTLFIPKHTCDEDRKNESVARWENKLDDLGEYQMCMDRKGHPVFMHPNVAFAKVIWENPKGILHMMWNIQKPISRYTYISFASYYNASTYPTNDVQTIKQIDRIKYVLGLYENSYR